MSYMQFAIDAARRSEGLQEANKLWAQMEGPGGATDVSASTIARAYLDAERGDHASHPVSEVKTSIADALRDLRTLVAPSDRE